MGLGLFLARSLAEQLGGALELRSKAAEGTTVSLSLPGEDAKEAAA
ncbi:ATP-binding protein [Corallococcus sp. AB049A]